MKGKNNNLKTDFIVLTHLLDLKIHVCSLKQNFLLSTNFIGIINCDTFPVVPSVFNDILKNVVSIAPLVPYHGVEAIWQLFVTVIDVPLLLSRGIGEFLCEVG